MYRQLEKYSDTQEKTFQKIQSLKKSGLGYRKIAQNLNEGGVTTIRGNYWNGNNVYSVLKRHNQREESIAFATHETEAVWSKMVLTFEKNRLLGR